MKNLDPIIAAAVKAGQPLLNLPKDNYILEEMALLPHPIHILFNHSTLVAPVNHAVFDCHAPVIVSGVTCSKANCFFHVNAGVNDCELNDTVLSNVLNAVKGENGAGVIKCENVYCGWDPKTKFWGPGSKSVTFYGTVSLLNCKGRSLGEYAIRFEGGGFSLIVGGEYTNAGNAFGKDTIGARDGDGELNGVIIHGNIRVGQEPPTNTPGTPLPTGSASKLKIHGCTFMDQSPGHTYVEIKQGVECWEWNNIWKPAKEPNFAAVSQGSILHHTAPT